MFAKYSSSNQTEWRIYLRRRKRIKGFYDLKSTVLISFNPLLNMIADLRPFIQLDELQTAGFMYYGYRTDIRLLVYRSVLSFVFYGIVLDRIKILFHKYSKKSKEIDAVRRIGNLGRLLWI